jgi:hypothetical protein
MLQQQYQQQQATIALLTYAAADAGNARRNDVTA